MQPFMHKYYIVIVFMIPIFVNSQVKYAGKSKSLLGASISYATFEQYKSIGGQLGYVKDGRVGFGIMYSLATSSDQHLKNIGFYIEGAIIKPDTINITGLNFAFATSRAMAKPSK